MYQRTYVPKQYLYVHFICHKYDLDSYGTKECDIHNANMFIPNNLLVNYVHIILDV